MVPQFILQDEDDDLDDLDDDETFDDENDPSEEGGENGSDEGWDEDDEEEEPWQVRTRLTSPSEVPTLAPFPTRHRDRRAGTSLYERI